jgi:hypothetical protein
MIKNDNGDLPNQVTLQAYVNMSQWNLPIQVVYANKSIK